MPPKHIKLGQTHGYVGDKPKGNYKPKPVDDSLFRAYWYKRDMIWYNDMFCSEDLRNQIKKRLDNNTYGLETI